MRRTDMVVFGFLAAAVAGCSSVWQEMSGPGGTRQGVSSSLVDFLYPGGEQPPAQDGVIPELKVPLRVGLAFVPAQTIETPGLSEAHKAELLGKVRDAFSDREFISSIEVIPENYLRSRRGFDTLEQVSRLYQLDVIALVSYDQIVHTDDRASSILYWTIVGAYVVKGSQNDVQTFVDTAIFDVPTRRLLFRAPGVDKLSMNTTLVGSGEAMREGREQGFARAMSDMTTNLTSELERFRERIKEDRSVRVSQRSGSGGGGAGGPLMLLAVLVAAGRRARRNGRVDTIR